MYYPVYYEKISQNHLLLKRNTADTTALTYQK